MRRAIYMAVTPDVLELPLFVTPNVQELADRYNVSTNAIFSSISHNKDGTKRGAKFVRVYEDDED